MIVEFSVVPMGKGDSVSEEVSEILDLIDKSGLDYSFTSMSTIVEGEWDEVIGLIKNCHEKMKIDAPRVVTDIKIDDHKGRKNRIKGKIESVENKLNKDLRK